MNFNELPEFDKEFKWLIKKHKSLSDDLEEFKRVITAEPLGNSKHFTVITKNDRCAMVKARLFCRYLKESSLRIIYAFHCNKRNVVMTGGDACPTVVLRVDFIEMYYQGSKENENRERINEYLNSL